MDYFNKYTFLRNIGKGAFGNFNIGEANLVRDKFSGHHFISKSISTIGMTKNESEKVHQEALLMKKFKHPHIVEYVESFATDSEIIIVMENCEGGDLTQLISYHKKISSFFPESTILDWLFQLLSALSHIHSLKIIHRDIKPSNIFITKEGKLKLGDFGISKVLETSLDVAITQIGTPLYMSPEVCNNEPYTSKCDIWSLGCVVYELATFKPPFFAGSLVALALKIIEEEPEEIKEYSSTLVDIIAMMLMKKEKSRPTANDILKIIKEKNTAIDEEIRADVPEEEEELYYSCFEMSKTFGFETFVKKNVLETSAGDNYEDDFEDCASDLQESGDKYEEDFEV